MNPNAKSTKKFSFNNALVAFAIIILLGGIVMLVKYLFFSSRYTTTNDAQIEQYISPMASRVPGFVKEVRFEENQFVKKGDTLFIIDDREYKNKLAMADAELLSSRTTVEASQKAISATAGSIAVQQAKVAASKVKVWQTKQDFTRIGNLLAEEAATQQDYEHVKAAYDMAVAQLNAAQEEYNNALLNTSKEQASALPIQATVKFKEAAKENMSLILSYAVVTAAFDGYVGRKTIQEGQLIKEGQTLVELVSKERWITANFREKQIENIDVGTAVNITVDAYPSVVFTGKIKSFSPASGSRFSMIPQENATGNFVKIEQRIPVKIVFDDNQAIDKLRAGMNVVVHATSKK
ncbi:HlyD family secretion protein [Sphingobacteriaceae bacterium WQ 2009]|uniref:HlyD family secretion protein n=1 Tax=Rhinopithecimicrobium faecis TaxID=2820698 RepID=A0A8T4HB77_9SPHI|nr:HlyD family secretion protein [Sphingobacteriaceae bacterium WQ 2009]